MLLQALLLQILFSIRGERLLIEAIDYNLLYRWFLGLNIKDEVWNHFTFSANRDRPFNEDLARVFFERVKRSAQWNKLASDEDFSMDGTFIDAWASHKSFKRKGDDSATPPGRNPEVNFKGQQRCNDTHESTTVRNIQQPTDRQHKNYSWRVDKYVGHSNLRARIYQSQQSHIDAKEWHTWQMI